MQPDTSEYAASTLLSANQVREPIMNKSAGSIDFISCHQAELRDWHITFARRSLREVVFEQTAKLLGALSNPASIDRVPAAIMRRVAQDLARSEEDLLPHASGIRVRKRMLGMLELFVFEMPRPLAPGEAHFVGVVNAYTSIPRMHYFTLERRAGRESALLGWDGAGGQKRIGGDIEPTLDTFVDAIADHLNSLVICGLRPGPADSAGLPKDGLSRDMLSVASVSALLDRASVDAVQDTDNQFRIRDLDIGFRLILPKTRFDYLTLCAWWATDPEISASRRLMAANRINQEYLYIRASIDEDDDLCLSQNLPVLSGVSGKYLVAVLRNFANACREAMLEHGNGITRSRARD